MAEVVATFAALGTCGLLVRAIVRRLFDGATERAARWMLPRKPTRMDIFMSELAEESRWHFGRVILIAVLTPLCFVLTFVVVRGLLSALV